MQDRLLELHAIWTARGFQQPFVVRMGINTGYCNVGNFGSSERLSYTIVGGEVNVAARLEANADPGGMLISYETYALVKDLVSVDERQSVRMKGIDREIRTFAVIGRSASSMDESTISLKDSAGIEITLSTFSTPTLFSSAVEIGRFVDWRYNTNDGKASTLPMLCTPACCNEEHSGRVL
ncbi:MAG: adenylate/guanylate cyclase domain-containing protein [Betaproteobacteria bacterium]|nr:adenylate/guanylate cyclase domain-containing protein [Betaproteobacteria bacterium]